MVQASRHHTTNLAAADVIFVDDYCLTTSIIAMYHSGAYSDGWEPLAQLGLAYKVLAKSARSVSSKAHDTTCCFIYGRKPSYRACDHDTGTMGCRCLCSGSRGG